MEGVSPVKIWREAKKRYQYLGKTGRLVSFTKVRHGPAGFERNSPYWAGIVKPRRGKRVTGQIVGIKTRKLTPGMKVKGVLRKLRGDSGNVIEYGVKFKIV